MLTEETKKNKHKLNFTPTPAFPSFSDLQTKKKKRKNLSQDIVNTYKCIHVMRIINCAER